eukprot:27219_1
MAPSLRALRLLIILHCTAVLHCGSVCTNNFITTGQTLNNGESIESPNCNYTLIINNGSLQYLHTPTNAILFEMKNTVSNSARLALQTDGNLVLYDTSGSNAAIWSPQTTTTSPNIPYTLRVDNDGTVHYRDNLGIFQWGFSPNKLESIWINIMDEQYGFGVHRDGIHDDTSTIQNAINYVYLHGGGSIHIPTGKYLFNGSTSLYIQQGVSLVGSYINAPSHQNTDQSVMDITDGTVFIVQYGHNISESHDQYDAMSFIQMSTDSSLKGVVIYYINQMCSESAPIPYPPTIYLEGKNIGVTDIELLNSYYGIKAVKAIRHYIARVHGQPIKVGIFVDEIYDIGRIENVQWNPWFCRKRGYLYTQTVHGVAFMFHRTDWQYVLNTFSFLYNIGYLFDESATGKGGCNGNFVGIGSDASVYAAVVVRGSLPFGLLITNGEFVAFTDVDAEWSPAIDDDPIHVVVESSNSGPITFEACSFWGAASNIAYLMGDGVVTFTSSTFLNWDYKKNGAATIVATNGYLILNGNSFSNTMFNHDQNVHIQLHENVKEAALSSNICVDCEWKVKIAKDVPLQCDGQFNGHVLFNYRLSCNESIFSSNCHYQFMMQCDAMGHNVILYDRIMKEILYSTALTNQTSPDMQFVIQSDGNLVLRDKTEALWSSRTATGDPITPYVFYVTDDGNIEWKDGNNDMVCRDEGCGFEALFDANSTPTVRPTRYPTVRPTANPTKNPVITTTANPTENPTLQQTANPTQIPVRETMNPTSDPTIEQTKKGDKSTGIESKMDMGLILGGAMIVFIVGVVVGICIVVLYVKKRFQRLLANLDDQQFHLQEIESGVQLAIIK